MRLKTDADFLFLVVGVNLHWHSVLSVMQIPAMVNYIAGTELKRIKTTDNANRVISNNSSTLENLEPLSYCSTYSQEFVMRKQ